MLSLVVGALAFAFVAVTWAMAFFYAPVDEHQGQVYRIIFLHVPSAMTAFSSAAVLLVLSLVGLKTRSEGSLLWARATAETGLMFTALTLMTGSIWGRPTWGVWWTWDARLTTTLLMALLYAGYLLLYATMAPGPGRVRSCAVLGILISVDVPIIYKSVSWWRTLHQPPSMFREGGSTMSPEILTTLLTAMAAMICMGGWLLWQRGRNLKLADELERASFDQLKA
jgi:heme exporter protein C